LPIANTSKLGRTSSHRTVDAHAGIQSRLPTFEQSPVRRVSPLSVRKTRPKSPRTSRPREVHLGVILNMPTALGELAIDRLSCFSFGCHNGSAYRDEFASTTMWSLFRFHLDRTPIVATATERGTCHQCDIARRHSLNKLTSFGGSRLYRGDFRPESTCDPRTARKPWAHGQPRIDTSFVAVCFSSSCFRGSQGAFSDPETAFESRPSSPSPASTDRLAVARTKVTDAGVKDLQTALPKCKIRR
jgi:hypothetical protein